MASRPPSAFQQAFVAAVQQQVSTTEAKVYHSRVDKQLAELSKDVGNYFLPKHLKGKKCDSLPSLVRDASSIPASRVATRSETPTHRRIAAFTYETSFAEIPTDDGKCDSLAADSPFIAPWQDACGESTWHAGSPPGQYLRSCQDQGSMPKSLPFITGNSMQLQASGIGLTDYDLNAMSSMLFGLKVSEVDLGYNAHISDKGIAALLDCLQGQHTGVYSLQRLTLNHCTRAGRQTMNVVLSIVAHPSSHLSYLDLSGIVLGTKNHEQFCEVVQTHQYLRVLAVANTGLNAACVIDIFNSRSLEELDLSWNCYTADIFSKIGEHLVETQHLQRLSLSNCSTSEEEITPIVYFLEHLAKDAKLKSLDISMNRVDSRAILVIEDALAFHKRLSELNLSGNPLGVLGMRSLLRLLARETSGLRDFMCESCSSAPDCKEKPFSAANPAGRYSLNLSLPHQRATLRMLYKACERMGMAPGEGFRHVHYSLPPYNHPSKDGSIWLVPCRGSLRFTFDLEAAMGKAFEGVDYQDFGLMLEKYREVTRLKPSFNKVIPLCAHWKSLYGHYEDQRVFLKALSKDFLLTYPQVSEMNTSHPISIEDGCNSQNILAALLCTLTGGQSRKWLAIMDCPSIGEYVKTIKQVHRYLFRNTRNPTGHYNLDLQNCCDYTVAQELVVLNEWEHRHSTHNRRVDTSQKGDGSHFRNVFYERCTLCTNVSEWTMPERGIFEFDYVSGARPKHGEHSPELSTVCFTNILLVLGQSECSPMGQVTSLRQIAHCIYLRCEQLREMLGIFSTVDVRMEAFVALFLRLTDIWNEKVFRVRFEDPQETLNLQRRLGNATFFPFIQPEHVYFEYDLAVYDQRLAANLICRLNQKECASGCNIKDYSFHHANGKPDDMPYGVPPSWVDFSKIPTSGVFRGHYVCSPQDRCYPDRKHFLEMYGGWTAGIREDQVMWWAGLSEAPAEVIEYLEVIATHHNGNLTKAFNAIVPSSATNGGFTLQTFEESIRKLSCGKVCKKCGPKGEKCGLCKKFGDEKLVHEKSRMIFRFLDSSSEGEISIAEWNELELLWKEIMLSIDEFKTFLDRTFHHSLRLAWDFFDCDGSGEIDIKEWCDAVRKVKYYGPVKQTFHYIDIDQQGTVDYKEFTHMWRRRGTVDDGGTEDG
jgi:hypothetical protein